MSFKLVAEFPVSSQIINVLTKSGVKTVEDLQNLHLADIKAMKGMGAQRVTELRVFMRDAGLKLKKAEKVEKVAKYPPETKEIVRSKLGRVDSWPTEMKCMGKLIQKFGVDTMRRVQLPPHVNSFKYFFTGGEIARWADNYILKYAPLKIIEEEKPKPEEAIVKPEVAYVPAVKQPQSLSEFLKSRNL